MSNSLSLPFAVEAPFVGVKEGFTFRNDDGDEIEVAPAYQFIHTGHDGGAQIVPVKARDLNGKADLLPELSPGEMCKIEGWAVIAPRGRNSYLRVESVERVGTSGAKPPVKAA